MKAGRKLFPALISFAMALGAVAQNQPPLQDQGQQPEPTYPAQQQYSTPPPAPPTPAPEVREWVPQGIAALGQNATSRTEFTLDHSMLVLATKLDKDNVDLRRVIAGVNGVSVHSFRYAGGVVFDPALMGAISQQYRDAGWMHVASKRKGDTGLNADWWIHMDHASIRDVAVLFSGVRQMNFVTVSGSIAPLDLLRLSGHFGIPRMDGGMAVPVPESK